MLTAELLQQENISFPKIVISIFHHLSAFFNADKSSFLLLRMWMESHIFLWVQFLQSMRWECRACLPLRCLGSRRGGKETRATLQQQVSILPTARQVNLCRHQYVNLARFIFFWLNRHLGHVQPGLNRYNAFFLRELTWERKMRWESHRIKQKCLFFSNFTDFNPLFPFKSENSK